MKRLSLRKIKRAFHRTLRGATLFYEKKIKGKRVIPIWAQTSLVIGFICILVLSNSYKGAESVLGAFTTSSTDADGNAHLASNTVTDTQTYDTTKDSSEYTKQQLGIDPNWRNGISRQSYALNFTGSSGQASVSDADYLDVGSNSFTIEAWVRIADGTKRRLLNKWSTDGWTLDVNSNSAFSASVSGNLRFHLNSGSGGVTVESGQAAGLVVGTWAHVAVVVNRAASEFRMYANGSLVGTAVSLSTLASIDNAGALAIANIPSSVGDYFNGDIDEVRYSSGTRYLANFTPSRRFTEDSTTIALYHLDEGTSTTVRDSSINRADLTLTGTYNWISGQRAIMDGFQGCNPDTSETASCQAGGRSGAGNIALTSNSSTTSDKQYTLKITGSSGIQLDGSNDYAATSSVVSAVIDNFTVEAWIKPTSLAQHGYIFGNGNTGATNGWGFYVGATALGSGSNLFADFPGVAYLDSGYTFANAGTWYHVVMQRSSGTTSFYVNGIQTANTYSNTPVTPTGSSRVGIYADLASHDFTGSIDEVRVSTAARYTKSFTPPRRFATDGNTVALWHFDEGTSTTVADVSGNSNTLTLMNGSSNSPAANGTTNGPIWVEAIGSDAQTTSTGWQFPGYQFRKKLKITNNVASSLGVGYGVETTEDRGVKLDNKQSRPDGNDWRITYQPGDQLRSLSFDGVNDFVNLPANLGGLDFSSGFSISSWVKPTSGDAILFYLGNGGDTDRITITNYSSTQFMFDINNTSQVIVNKTLLNNGQWNSVVATMDSSKVMNLYVNGVFVGTTTAAAMPTNTTRSAAYIGRSNNGGSPVYETGSIDDTRFYLSALSATQAISIYNGGISSSNTVGSSQKGWWKIDEGSGQTLRDFSGNENNALLGADSASASDDPTWVTTDGATTTAQEIQRFIPAGHAVSLDGSNDHILNSSLSSSVTADFTVETWFKAPAVQSATKQLLDIAKSAAAGVQINMDTGGLVSMSGSFLSGTVTASGSKADGAWHHVAVVRVGTKDTLYIDGNYIGYATESSVQTYTKLYVGIASTGGSTAFLGQVDEVRLSTTPRYKSNFTTTNSPLAKDSFTLLLWHLDENTGTSATDSSGNSNTGTLTNGPVWVGNGGKIDSINQTQFKTVAPIGASSTDSDYYLYYGSLNEQGSAQSYISTALKLDGSSAYVTIPSASSLNLTGAGTWMGWYKFASVAGTQSLMTKDNSSGYSVTLTGSKASLYINGGATVSETTSLSTGTWYHIAITKSGTTATFYLNGTADGTGTVANVIPTNSLALGLGRNISGANQAFNGTFDDVRIYNTALSATDIAAAYSNTPVVSSSSLVGWWKGDMTSPASTTFTDSSGNSNTGTITGSNFDSSSGYIVNQSLLHASAEPSITIAYSSGEQESPVFFGYASNGSTTFTTGVQISAYPVQLGSEGVYVKFNPNGLYSRQDYYIISSWAVEAFTTSTPQRGKLRSFPEKAHLVTNSSGLDIIDASTNKLWMRLPIAANNMVGAGAPQQVAALNGRIYVVSTDGLTDLQLDLDRAQRYTSSGNSAYSGYFSGRRNADSSATYAAASGASIVSTTANDVAVKVIGSSPPKQYVVVATSTGMTDLANETAAAFASATTTDITNYTYSKNTNDGYSDVALSTTGYLYGSNTTAGGLDRYDTINSDVASQSTSADRSYTTATTPALKSNTINDITLAEGVSNADYTSNEVILATNAGVNILDEHTTFASSLVRYYMKQASTGTSGWNSKNFGGALEFDASNDYVSIPHNASLSLTSAMTVEAWVKTSSTSAQTVVAKGTFATNPNYVIDINNNSCGVRFFGYGASVFGITSGVGNLNIATDGAWHHIAGTFDGVDAWKIYVDGTLLFSKTDAATLSSNSTVVNIGARYPGNLVFGGQIDELRLSDTVRYTAAFKPQNTPFTRDANTKGLYHLDERNGQTVGDDSGNGNTGTLGATSSVASDDPTRVIPSLTGTSDTVKSVGYIKPVDSGNFLNFDGSNDFAEAPHTSSLAITGDLTISAWVKPTDFSATDSILGKTAAAVANPYDFYLNTTTGTPRLMRGNGTLSAGVTGTTGLTAATWQHIVVTMSSTTVTHYLNGASNGSGSLSTTVADGGTALRIGTRVGAGAFMKGGLDDVRIYNRALTPTEVSGLYNGGAGRIDNPYSGNVAWWRLNEATGQSLADSSGSANTGTLGASSASASDDPTWTTGSPVKDTGAFWAATNDGASGGGVSAISLVSDRQIAGYSTSNSSLPSNNITSIGMASGGLAIAGTDAGAWPAGFAGIVVDDTATTVAASTQPARIKSGGTTRIKSGGTVRIRPN